jgi:hypothetical protein
MTTAAQNQAILTLSYLSNFIQPVERKHSEPLPSACPKSSAHFGEESASGGQLLETLWLGNKQSRYKSFSPSVVPLGREASL